MKKSRIVTVVLLVALALVLASCSQDAAASLGNIMGKMGNNVWGIKADTRKAEAAAETVSRIDSSESVQDPEIADKLIESVKGFVGSEKNVEAFHAEMSEPSNLEADKFQTSVAAVEVKTKNIQAGPLKDAFANVMTAFCEMTAFDEMTDIEIRNGDVAALTLVNSLLDEVISPTATKESIAQKAGDVLTVLKLTTGFSELNVIDDIDLSGIFSAMSSNKTNNKAVSRDDDPNTFLLALGKTLEKIANLITDDDGIFNNPKFRRFHMEAKAIKLAYEVAMSPYFAEGYNLGDTIERVCNGNRPKTEASLDDLVMYVCASVSCYVDNISKLSERFLTQYLSKTIIDALANANMTVLKEKAVNSMETVVEIYRQESQDLSSDEWTILINAIADETGTDEKAVRETISTIKGYLDNGGSLSNIFNNLLSENQEYIIDTAVKNLIEDLQTSLADIIESIRIEAKYFVGTVAGILFDSGFDTIIHRIEGMVAEIKLNSESET